MKLTRNFVLLHITELLQSYMAVSRLVFAIIGQCAWLWQPLYGSVQRYVCLRTSRRPLASTDEAVSDNGSASGWQEDQNLCAQI